jgi:hypothetical protein
MIEVRRNEEDGAIIVMVAFLLTALIGVAALTVDLGGMLMKRRQMVNAADAGALAAAQWCAEIEGALAQSSSAESHANVVAQSNVSDASSKGISFSGLCPGPSGEVTVDYTSPQNLFFAPALGLGDTRPVDAKATAIWGPAGVAPNVVPVVVSLDQAIGDCDIPGGSPGLECNFWYDDKDMGNSLWGFLDLSNWDVAPGASCPNAGAGPRSDWIDDGFPDALGLNYPSPTYVCTTSGHAASVWSTLQGKVGEVLTFPVNDPATQLPPLPAAPDKYNIIGFTGLRVLAIYDGNDPEAIGTSAAAIPCGTNLGDIGPNAVFGLNSLPCYQGPPATITNLVVRGRLPGPGGPVPLTPGTHYGFDATTGIVTFGPTPLKNVTIDFDVNVAGTAGLCEPPERVSDPNAKCVVTEWAGFIPTGTEPGGGADLGVRAIRLTE